MSVVPSIAEHIEITPGVCGGKPRIAGHRIRVQDVAVWHERMGMSPDEIVLHYPSITRADVYAALTYYHDHKDEILAQMAEGERFAEEMRSRTPSLLLKKLGEEGLRRRLAGGPNDSLPLG